MAVSKALLLMLLLCDCWIQLFNFYNLNVKYTTVPQIFRLGLSAFDSCPQMQTS